MKKSGNLEHIHRCMLSVKVTPGSRSDEVLGFMDDGETLRIKLRAPAVDGKANKALVSFLSKRLGVAKSSITILRGEKSRLKRVEICGVDEAGIRELSS